MSRELDQVKELAREVQKAPIFMKPAAAEAAVMALIVWAEAVEVRLQAVGGPNTPEGGKGSSDGIESNRAHDMSGVRQQTGGS